jgi:hypothetical protein
MLKLLIKVVIAALIIHACWRSTNAVLRYSKFKDAVHETLLFHSTLPDPQLEARVLEIAHELDVPLDAEHIAIRRIENRTIIDAAYTDRIELLPTKFYPWQFKVSTDIVNVNLPSSQDIGR